jgi:hypothetical protein
MPESTIRVSGPVRMVRTARCAQRRNSRARADGENMARIETLAMAWRNSRDELENQVQELQR